MTILGEDQRITHAKAFKTAKKTVSVLTASGSGCWSNLIHPLLSPPQRSHVEPLLPQTPPRPQFGVDRSNRRLSYRSSSRAPPPASWPDGP
jgi:hypothetical protein